MPTHTMSANLVDSYKMSWGKKGSRVRLSLSAAPTHCVVFVHGFMGAATSTWDDFPAFLTTTPIPKASLADCDLYFYEYDWRARVTASSGILRNFIEKLARSPSVDIINPSLGQFSVPGAALPWRSPAFRYQHITFCAHSLGAVVVRRALLDLAGQRPPRWLANTQLILYAPAHCGAHLIPLMQTALGTFGGLVGLAPPLLQMRFPVLNDLQPGAAELVTLLGDTNSAIVMHGQTPWLVAKVVEAGLERVVVTNRFASDPPSTPIAGTDHRSVCKPMKNALLPLTHFVGWLP